MTRRKTMMIAALAIPLALVAAVLLWLGISYALSFVGGWTVLGDGYPTRPCAETRDLGTSSLTLDRGFIVVNYNRSVRFTICAEGLGMEVSSLFRKGHPPVLIPWSEVESCESKKLLTGEGTAITLKGHRVNILVRGPAAAEVMAAWNGRAKF